LVAQTKKEGGFYYEGEEKIRHQGKMGTCLAGQPITGDGSREGKEKGGKVWINLQLKDYNISTRQGGVGEGYRLSETPRLTDQEKFRSLLEKNPCLKGRNKFNKRWTLQKKSNRNQKKTATTFPLQAEKVKR